MKLYRLKEEVKKYFNTSYHSAGKPLEWWEDELGATIEAIEEVEERLTLRITHNLMNEDNMLLHKFVNGSNAEWTEEEREFLEFCLNEIGSKEKLDEIANEWSLIKTTDSLIEWLENKE